MAERSEKTNQWILGCSLFNLFVFLYVYLFFYEEWISTLFSIIIPLFVWEVLFFGIMAPDDVFMDLFGTWDNAVSTVRNAVSPVPSARANIVSSGDH